MKHAYLITSHNNFVVLKYALSLIDDSRNVVFLLVDKKTKDENLEELSQVMKKSPLIVLPRINIHWAGFSQIEAELNLIEAAVNFKEEFSYYHFLQGVDLPIKSQDEIHNFFEANSGIEFIDFNPKMYDFAMYKKGYFHFFVDNKYFRTNMFVKIINHSLVRLQKLIGISRKMSMQLYHGSALFSITDNFARYILENKLKIIQEYKFTLACDEVFI